MQRGRSGGSQGEMEQGQGDGTNPGNDGMGLRSNGMRPRIRRSPGSEGVRTWSDGTGPGKDGMRT